LIRDASVEGRQVASNSIYITVCMPCDTTSIHVESYGKVRTFNVLTANPVLALNLMAFYNFITPFDNTLDRYYCKHYGYNYIN